MACVALVACASPDPEVRFVDQTAEAGIDRRSPTYDAAVADFDGDGHFDVYVGNHEYAAALLRNDGARFEDRIEPSGIEPSGDQHGTTWTDIDNDGRLDLFVSLGAFRGQGQKENRLYRNLGQGRFERVPPPTGLEDPTGRSRATATFDFDGDGWLDILIANHDTPTRLFRNRGDGSFEDVSEAAGVLSYSSETVTWSDYDLDGFPDVLFTQGPNGARLLRNVNGERFEDVTESVGIDPWDTVGGAAFGDYDNDGVLDLYLSRGWGYVPGAWPDGRGNIRFALFGKDSPRGFDFFGGSGIEVELFQKGAPVPEEQVVCGSETRPASHRFHCAGDAAAAGEPPAIEPGYAIWRDPDPEGDTYRWHLRWYGTGDWNESGTIFGGRDPEVVGVPAETPRGGSLYQGNADGTFSRVQPTGLAPDVNGQGAAWIDLNADGWLDLYAVDAGADGAPSQSQLFLNDAGRGFVLAPEVSGATPRVVEGRPASVQYGDFDRDGRVDLFMTNGWGAPPFNRGPYRFLRNTSVPQHWLELELEGTTSNRPALGARIEIEACGLRQIRVHDGGRSDLSQSVVGPYFGLGDCDVVDRLVVRWPSGQTSERTAIAADQVLHVKEPPPPDVILVVIDTLRAKSLSLYGYERETSPSLERFARDAIVYDNATSTGTWTVPAHGSLFTGRLPSFHGAERVAGGKFARATPINPDVPMLAELLSDHGWTAGAFVANSTFVTPSLGFARGFEPFVGNNKPAETIVPQALAWFETTSRPTFFFLNILDPHEPYEPSPPYVDRYPGRDESFGPRITDLYWDDDVEFTPPMLEHFRSQYDGEISSADVVLGQFFERLRELGRYDESLIIVTSDHGELLGEHGLAGHGISTHQEIVHVPLIVKRPGNVGGGARVERRVSTMGIFSEILRVAGLPPPPGTQAKRLDHPHDVWVEDINFDGDRVTVRFEQDDKMVHILAGPHRQSAELYDLADDPDELEPRDPMSKQDLGAEILRHEALPRPTHDLPPPVIDPTRELKLRELGYAF